MKTYKRTPLPPLEYRNPDCPTCGTEVGHDGDSFWCETCGGTWGTDHGDPGNARDDVPQCGAEVEPWADDTAFENLRGHRYRCVLNAGHPLREFVDRHVGVRSDAAAGGAAGYDIYGSDTYSWDQGKYPQAKRRRSGRPAQPATRPASPVQRLAVVNAETTGGVL